MFVTGSLQPHFHEDSKLNLYYFAQQLKVMTILLHNTHRHVPLNNWGNLSGRITVSISTSLACCNPATSSHLTLGLSPCTTLPTRVLGVLMGVADTKPYYRQTCFSVSLSHLYYWYLPQHCRRGKNVLKFHPASPTLNQPFVLLGNTYGSTIAP